MNETDDSAQHLDVLVAPDAEILGLMRPSGERRLPQSGPVLRRRPPRLPR